jgi:antitoxin FitA
MKNMSVKNIPDHTHKALKKQAETNHRSLNKEILAILERSIGNTSYQNPNTEKLLAEIREVRKRFKGSLTIEQIDRAKREGRA